jgi:transcriptional regulator with XRE-family HTH domain
MYKRIKELREDNDLTQTQVGEAINITQRTYSYYETGQRMMPPEVLIKLAKFYGTTVDYILGLTNEKKPYGQD